MGAYHSMVKDIGPSAKENSFIYRLIRLRHPGAVSIGQFGDLFCLQANG
jgi:hypothetical protein